MKKRNKIITGIAVTISAVIVLILLTGAIILFVGLEPGWHKIGDTSLFYITEEGDLATGYQLIGDEPYYFNYRGRPYKAGWIDDDSGEHQYYCTGDGRLATGWKYMDGKAWYFYQNSDVGNGGGPGEIARDYTTSGGITIGKKGYIDGEEGEALGYGMDVLNRYGWNLRSAFKYSSSLKYADGRDNLYGLTIHSCARHGFKYGQGNCLAWSSTFCVMAKLLGYDCRLVWGTLRFRGEDVTHAWNEIWEEDGPHVYDPRKNGGKDFGGFDRHYGEKGTYKYNEDSITYLDW